MTTTMSNNKMVSMETDNLRMKVFVPNKLLERLPRCASLPKERLRWNTNEEIASYLISFDKHEEWLSCSLKTRPQNGSIILYNRKKVKYRKDGFCWKKRRDGKTTREDHMKLKVQGTECLYGCYVHSSIVPTFHRRCYWLLQNPDIVLVHYLNVPSVEDSGKCGPLLCAVSDRHDSLRWTRDDLLNQLTPMFHSMKWSCGLNGSSDFSVDQLVQHVLDSQLHTRPPPRTHTCLCTSVSSGAHRCNSTKHRIISPKLPPCSPPEPRDIPETALPTTTSTSTNGFYGDRPPGGVAALIVMTTAPPAPHPSSSSSSSKTPPLPSIMPLPLLLPSPVLLSSPPPAPAPPATPTAAVTFDPDSFLNSPKQGQTYGLGPPLSPTPSSSPSSSNPSPLPPAPPPGSTSPPRPLPLSLSPPSSSLSLSPPSSLSSLSSSLSETPPAPSLSLSLSPSLPPPPPIMSLCVELGPPPGPLATPPLGEERSKQARLQESAAPSLSPAPSLLSPGQQTGSSVAASLMLVGPAMPPQPQPANHMTLLLGHGQQQSPLPSFPTANQGRKERAREEEERERQKTSQPFSPFFAINPNARNANTSLATSVHHANPAAAAANLRNTNGVNSLAIGGLRNASATSLVSPAAAVNPRSASSTSLVGATHTNPAVVGLGNATNSLFSHHANPVTVVNVASVSVRTSPGGGGSPAGVRVKEERGRGYDHREDTPMDTTHSEAEPGGVERGGPSGGGEEHNLGDISFDSQFPDLISELITEGGASLAPSPASSLLGVGLRYMVPPSPFLPFPPLPPPPSSSDGRLATITDFSPEWSYPEGGVKVLITGPWSELSERYSSVFDQSAVPASLIQPGVLRCYCPAHSAGLVCLRVIDSSGCVSSSVLFEYRARNSASLQRSCQLDWLSLDDNQFRVCILERLEQMEQRMVQMNHHNNFSNNQRQHQTQQNGCQVATPPPPPPHTAEDRTQSSQWFERRIVGVCQRMIEGGAWRRGGGVAERLRGPAPHRGMTLLHLAAAQGYAHLIRTLQYWRSVNSDSLELEQEVDPLNVDHFSCTPLMWACALGHQGAAETLYLWRASALGLPDSLGRLPLAVARSRGHTHLACALERLHTQRTRTPEDVHSTQRTPEDVHSTQRTHTPEDVHTQRTQTPEDVHTQRTHAHTPEDMHSTQRTHTQHTHAQRTAEEIHTQRTHTPEVALPLNTDTHTAVRDTHTPMRETHTPVRDTHTPVRDTHTPVSPQPQMSLSPLSTSPDTGLSSSSSLPSPGDPSSPSPSSAYSSGPAPMDTSPSLSPSSPLFPPPHQGWAGSEDEEGQSDLGTGDHGGVTPPPRRNRASSPPLFLMDYENDDPSPPTAHTHSALHAHHTHPAHTLHSTLSVHTHTHPQGRRPLSPRSLEEQLLSYQRENEENEGEDVPTQVDMATLAEQIIEATPERIKQEDFPRGAESPLRERRDNPAIADTWLATYLETVDTHSLAPRPPSALALQRLRPPSSAAWAEFLNASSNGRMERDFALLTLTDSEQRELYEAARVIQSAFRRYKGRRLKEQQDMAAAVIQRCYRKYKQYALYKKMTEAAILIQSKFRSYYEQKRFQQSRRAAVLIQQYYRSYRIKGAFLTKKQDQAARKIMKFLRRCRHRIKELKQTKELERRGLTT